MTSISVDASPEQEVERLLFSEIASDLTGKGYAVIPNALPGLLSEELFGQIQSLHSHDFSEAGVGRNHDQTLNRFVRRDAIRWIAGETSPEQRWLDWTSRLQTYLNRHLFLGLFSYESHFSHYRPGDFYRKHLDAFRGQTNRRLSTVAYLNPGWMPDDGGELILFSEMGEREILRVTPAYGTLAIFLSEVFPHEVLPTNRHRYSIAGWFRVNGSVNDQLDPPV